MSGLVKETNPIGVISQGVCLINEFLTTAVISITILRTLLLMVQTTDSMRQLDILLVENVYFSHPPKHLRNSRGSVVLIELLFREFEPCFS